jgi:GTPase SAR1 family protein
MQFWGKVKKSVETTFWNGNSITKTTFNSLFGNFLNIIETLFHTQSNIITDNLDIPKIIVIGAESSGKSCLLENIIKCPIFPRNQSICTKQPIHVRLKTALTPSDIYYKITWQNKTEIIEKNLIVSKIESIMQLLSENEISQEEILVEICDINLPIFEFYDLPGIRAYPPEMAKQTLELSEHYIQQPNTIIVCVIPSTTPRLTSYQPIALVNKYKKQDNTILALTMADRIQPENIYELLISRITDKTDEFENNKFAGCIAVINRSHHNMITLEDNDKFEHEWFEKNIILQIPDEIPIEERNLIFKNIKINNLISNLDILYNNFIKNKWIPYTIVNFTDKIKNNEKEYIKLGCDIDLIDIAEFIEYYQEFFIDQIITFLGAYNNSHINSREHNIISKFLDTDDGFILIDTFDEYNRIFDKLTNILIEDCLEIEQVNELIDSLSMEQKTINMKRFNKLNLKIIESIKKQFQEKLVLSLITIKSAFMYDLLDANFNEFKFYKKLRRLISLIRTKIKIDKNYYENLEEDITYQQKRKILQEEKKAYLDAIIQMNELELKI